MQLNENEDLKSAGHALGQFVGDWWEKHVIYPILLDLARDLGLFLDGRMVKRDSRGAKILWKDAEENSVDYDFVLEFGGTSTTSGIPVGFIETFWRRGARHSKDKARDDTNKLLPMRDTYPTARFLAIAACGEFTPPARGYVTSRNVDLLFIPKLNIVNAFESVGLTIDYPDSAPEPQKLELVTQIQRNSSEEKLVDAAKILIKRSGKQSFDAFKFKIRSSLMALPQEIRITEARYSDTLSFKTIEDATDFLKARNFSYTGKGSSYRYEISYSDGYEFERSELSWDRLTALHQSLLSFVEFIKLK